MAGDSAAPIRANCGREVSDYYFLWTFVLHVAYAYCWFIIFTVRTIRRKVKHLENNRKINIYMYMVCSLHLTFWSYFFYEPAGRETLLLFIHVFIIIMFLLSSRETMTSESWLRFIREFIIEEQRRVFFIVSKESDIVSRVDRILWTKFNGGSVARQIWYTTVTFNISTESAWKISSAPCRVYRSHSRCKLKSNVAKVSSDVHFFSFSSSFFFSVKVDEISTPN